jgi:ferredoxin
MKQIVDTDIEKCQGCAACIGICPVKEANIACIDENKLRFRIDPRKCIACGACLAACPHKALFTVTIPNVSFTTSEP